MAELVIRAVCRNGHWYNEVDGGDHRMAVFAYGKDHAVEQGQRLAIVCRADHVIDHVDGISERHSYTYRATRTG